MMVENSFDRWQKDVFFSAAEEVQESADRMESIFRAWDRERIEGFQSDELDELRRELHTALGTAKWQLEEFERAVKLSHENGSAEHTISRHRQFVLAIEDQIFRIGKTLSDSLIEEGKQPLRWVQLDENERDDLAVFLSGTPGPSQDMKDPSSSLRHSMENVVHRNQQKEAVELGAHATQESRRVDCINKGFKDIVTINNNAKYVVELEAKEIPRTEDEMDSNGKTSSEQKPWSSPEMGSWKIVIADEDVAKKMHEGRMQATNRADNLCGLLRNVDCVTNLKWFRNTFRKAKDEEHFQLGKAPSSLGFRGMTHFTQGVNVLNERGRSCFSSCREDSNVSYVRQLFGRVGGLKRQVQGSQHSMQFSRSLQVTLVLMLTIFLIVPFVFYAN